ncbi:MAG: phytanoyl-CoA dioxygenase family protein [Planctomycetota bacterium]
MSNLAAAVESPIIKDMVSSYRRDGFVRVRGMVDREQALAWGETAQAFAANHRDDDCCNNNVFNQYVNAWRDDPAMAAITRDSRIAAAATKLAGVPLRLWHDQILIKEPGKSVATELHQDQPYWPHDHRPNSLSMWIALCDVPVERGCMTFIPGSHRHTELAPQDFNDAGSLLAMCPELNWDTRVTVPLRAGDCTFHHGRCAHMATPNLTADPRVAHVVIFIDADTPYDGQPHPVTEPLGLTVGQTLPDEMFPLA